MRFPKLAVPVLASLAIAASAVAIADGSADGSGDSTVTVVVYGSDDALGTSCVISVDGGDALATAALVPGANYIDVLDPGTPIAVDGDEVLGRSILDEGEGLN